MTPLAQLLTERLLLRNALATIALLLLVLLLRGAALRAVRRAGWASDQIKLRWTGQVRWASLLLLLLGLTVVWAEELRTLALSVVAIAAAIVIATKELILCLSGAVLRATTRAFSAGDRIEIQGMRGDVIDLGLLTITILETGPAHRRTGRAVVIPNSVLLAAPVVNETFTDDFVLHMITVPLAPQQAWQQAEQRLLSIAKEVCAPYLTDARRHMDNLSRRHDLPELGVEPTVILQLPETGQVQLLLRVPTRARNKGHTEQQILRRFLQTEW